MVCSTPFSESTPSITTRRVPAPEIRAPILTRKLARSTTSGSLAAESITVVPRASTAAIMRLSVPRTVGPCFPLMSISPPTSPSGALKTMSPASMSTLAPSPCMAFIWRSTGRSPITHPPGREIFARPTRVSKGPITHIEARIFLTRS